MLRSLYWVGVDFSSGRSLSIVVLRGATSVGFSQGLCGVCGACGERVCMESKLVFSFLFVAFFFVGMVSCGNLWLWVWIP